MFKYFSHRFTEGETLKYDSNTRNQCNSNSGGIEILGYGVNGATEKCKESLANTTNGINTRVERFTSTTYGTLPVGSKSLQDWEIIVNSMWPAEVVPIPIKQSLVPIVDIFRTSAVAEIKHDDGTLIDVNKVRQTAVSGYLNYLSIFKPSFDWACNKTLRLDNDVYRQQEFKINGRNVYKDEDESTEKSKYIFYSKNGFTVSTSFTSEEEDILTSSPCPRRGAKFEGPDILSTNESTWKACSKQCMFVADCNYWEHNNSSKLCLLKKDFENIISSSNNDFSIGTSDCPGNAYKYTEGLCVDRNPSRSMWKRKVGSDFFEKDLQTEGFDSNSVLIVGGKTDSVSYASETFFTNKDCQVENLPSSNAGHSLLLSAGDHKVLSCGGYHDNYKKNCLEWDTQNSQQKKWIWHSELTQIRFSFA